MADPLTYATEQMAPSRPTTNFFDPTPGENIIARYARVGREAEAERELARDRATALAERRNALMLDQDEEDYAAKKAYKLQRGAFLDQAAKLDPNADDYDAQVSTLLSGLPEEVRNDDALTSLLAHKNRMADERRAVMAKDLDRQQSYEDKVRLLKERLSLDKRFDVLPPEERAKYAEADDLVGAAFRAEQIRQEQEMGTYKAKLSEREKALVARKDPEMDEVESAIEGDPEAFPLQYPAVLQGILNNDPTAKNRTVQELEAKYPQLGKAKTWDKRQAKSEIEAAKNYKTEDEYVSKGPAGLSEAGKEKRRKVWRVAHRTAEAAPAATPTAAPAATPTATPTEEPLSYDPSTVKVINGKKFVKVNGKVIEIVD